MAGIGIFATDSPLGNLGPKQEIKFHKKQVQNAFKSAQAKSPVFEDILFVSIQMPSEREKIERPATEADFRRFVLEYAEHIKTEKLLEDGAPIELLNNSSAASHLRALGVVTLEQCSALSDDQKSKIGVEADKWVAKAKRCLEFFSVGAEFNKSEEQEAEIARLKKQLDILQTRYDKLASQIGLGSSDAIPLNRNNKDAYVPHSTTDGKPAIIDVQVAQINLLNPSTRK